ncbi:hypothetical protein [Rubrobacter indicoceani]|uniref:hypothetical protein n=1 Tax=Rubrobacter indicoceani TaxID=2051957 RepID=UPI000E5AC061|nr:hypothetical protein [Rubrobacter indicoceani]
MTERKLRLEPSAFAVEIAQEMTEAERGYGLPCCVRHAHAGGQCKRAASMRVYELAFCEVHGEEARIGALSELYDDAATTIERVDNPHAPLENAEAGHLLSSVVEMLNERCIELGQSEDEALLRAYPVISERVCTETQAYDYDVVNEAPYPEDVHMNVRRELHGLMRRAYEKGLIATLETLEEDREEASAQVAFALDDRERKTRSRPTLVR